MATPHTHARVLTVLRRTWNQYLVDNEGKLTQQSAEDFLASAQDALRTLADEIHTKLRLGVATEVRVFWEEDTWYTAVYFDDRRAKRCSLCEYFQMFDDASEEDEPWWKLRLFTMSRPNRMMSRRMMRKGSPIGVKAQIARKTTPGKKTFESLQPDGLPQSSRDAERATRLTVC